MEKGVGYCVLPFHRCTVIFKFFWGGYLGLWKNLGGGTLSLCFMGFQWSNFSKSFEGLHEVHPSPSPLCASIYLSSVWGSRPASQMVMKRWTDMMRRLRRKVPTRTQFTMRKDSLESSITVWSPWQKGSSLGMYLKWCCCYHKTTRIVK